jgi:uncharacterized protein YbaR (Trm112 family)
MATLQHSTQTDVELPDEVFDDSDGEDVLMIDESSPTKNNHDENKVPETSRNIQTACEENGTAGSEQSAESNDEDIENHDNTNCTSQTDASSSLKPIQAVLNRAKQPSNHSKQTRYQTRTRSCSLPARQSRYSSNETPFPIDTKISLIELATKLSAADNKVNGCSTNEKRSPGKQGKSPTQVNKSTLNSLKKKLQQFRASEEEPANSTQSINFELPASLVNSVSVTNGANHEGQAASSGVSNKLAKIDLTTEGQKAQTVHVSYINNEHILKHQQNLKDVKRFNDFKMINDIERAKELEERKAEEKSKSEHSAAFHARCLEFYNDALRVMSRLYDDPDDRELQSDLPSMEGCLPLWRLLSNTGNKSFTGSTFTAEIENAISESTTPDRSRRKRAHAVISTNPDTAEDIPGLDCNINSGALNIPGHITEVERRAIECLAVNHALRAKIPKFAKRAFEAAKYAAECGIKNTLRAEELRRDKAARGFDLPVCSNALNKRYINISSIQGNSQSMLIPVPVSFIPVQLAPVFRTTTKPAQLKLINSVPMTTTTTTAATTKIASSDSKPVTSGGDKLSADSCASTDKDKRRFKCPECNYTTDNRSHLRRHVVTVHSDIKPFKCYVCEKEFARGEKCKNHIEREHPDVPYDPKKTKRQHVKLAEDGVQWPLNVSPIDFEESTNDSAHTFDETVSEASIEKNESTSEATTNQEAKKASSEVLQLAQVFACQHCSYNARNIPQLQKHLAEVHSAVRRLKCGVCHYSTGRNPKMIMHMRKHGEFFCFYCDFSTVKSQLFYMHLRLCRKQHHSQVLTCPECKRVYPSRDLLQAHSTEEHGGLEVFVCDMCSYCDTDFAEFEKHTEKHFSGDVDSQCMKCNEVFSDTKELLAHAKDCTGAADTKLKCPMCTVYTNQPALLHEHLNTHIEDTVILCKMEGCKFSARWDNTMEQHMKLKHKISKPVQTGPKPKKKSRIVMQAGKQTDVSLTKPEAKQQQSLLKNPTTLFKPQVIEASPVFTSQALTAQPMVLHPVLNQTLPTLQSPTILQSPLNLSTVTLAGIPLTVPLNAVPIFSSNPIPIPNLSMLPTLHTNPAVTTTATTTVDTCTVKIQPKYKFGREKMPLAPASKYRTQPEVSAAPAIPAVPASSSSTVYDHDSGGIQGHGSGSFTCPLCPDRSPFKYRRSYEKHMYKHKKVPGAFTCPLCPDRLPFKYRRSYEKHMYKQHVKDKGQPPAPVFKIKCPVKYCRAAFDTNTQVEEHLRCLHGILKPDAANLKQDPEPVVVDSDEESEDEDKDVVELVMVEANSGILSKDEHGDVELNLDLNDGEEVSAMNGGEVSVKKEENVEESSSESSGQSSGESSDGSDSEEEASASDQGDTHD